MTTPRPRYTLIAICLHWAMALLLPILFAVGIYMHDLPLSPFKLQIYSWHKWAGITAFLLVFIRLCWRLAHRPPSLPDGISRASRAAAHFIHGLMYICMAAIPVSGWLMSSAKGYTTVYFGIWPIPDLICKNQPLGELLQIVHMSLNYLLAAIVAGHIAAAIKHQLFDQDQLLKRMMP